MYNKTVSTTAAGPLECSLLDPDPRPHKLLHQEREGEEGEEAMGVVV